ARGEHARARRGGRARAALRGPRARGRRGGLHAAARAPARDRARARYAASRRARRPRRARCARRRRGDLARGGGGVGGGRVTAIRLRRHPLAALLRARGFEGHHELLLRGALEPWSAARKSAGRPLGSALAVGAGWREAKALGAYPFDRIVLSGIAEPDAAV